MLDVLFDASSVVSRWTMWTGKALEREKYIWSFMINNFRFSVISFSNGSQRKCIQIYDYTYIE